ncbi:MAG: helix-turn-helix domain-containing protein [Phycisphaerales bacterium]|nr:helix-turn-helix domain-containing protein [Phycisphaerales bacterium]
MPARKEASKAVEPKLWTVPETATVLHISPRSVWRLIGANEIEVVRLGKCTRVRISSVERLLAAGGVR